MWGGKSFYRSGFEDPGAWNFWQLSAAHPAMSDLDCQKKKKDILLKISRLRQVVNAFSFEEKFELKINSLNSFKIERRNNFQENYLNFSR